MPRRVRVQLVVTDLDGTLWDADEQVHAAVLDAIGQIAETSVPLLVATGRRLGSTRSPLAAMGLQPPAVVLNGALGVELDSGRRFHCTGFSTADAIAVLAAFASCDVEPCVYVDDHAPEVWVGDAPSTDPRHLEGFGDHVGSGQLDDVVRTQHVLAFGVLGLEHGLAVRLEAVLGRCGEVHVAPDNYDGFGISVAPAGQSKWDGVVAYCRAHAIDESAVLAIGDGPNDVELLERATVAVAIADGHRRALAAADHVVGPPTTGGWADIVHLVRSGGHHFS